MASFGGGNTAGVAPVWAPGSAAHGPLVIKARLGNDVRRIPIHREDLTYDDLILMMQRVFGARLSQDDDILVKYTDADGDKVTIMDNADLTHATQQARLLRLTLYINGQLPPVFDPGMVEDIRDELSKVVGAVTELVKKLDIVAKTTAESSLVASAAPLTGGSTGGRKGTPSTGGSSATDGNDSSTTAASLANQETVNTFDPLAEKPQPAAPAAAPPAAAPSQEQQAAPQAAPPPSATTYQAATSAAGNAAAYATGPAASAPSTGYAQLHQQAAYAAAGTPGGQAGYATSAAAATPPPVSASAQAGAYSAPGGYYQQYSQQQPQQQQPQQQQLQHAQAAHPQATSQAGYQPSQYQTAGATSYGTQPPPTGGYYYQQQPQ